MAKDAGEDLKWFVSYLGLALSEDKEAPLVMEWKACPFCHPEQWCPISKAFI
jgi:hypothetical protein